MLGDGDHSLTFEIPVDRVVGNVTHLTDNGLLQGSAILKLPAYDIDYAGGGGINPERDRVYFNGHLVPATYLTGASGTWSLNSFAIDTSWVNFPPDPVASNPSVADAGAPPPLTPAMNTVEIVIDTGNTKTLSCTAIDWASLSISVARPVLLVHGILSGAKTWGPWVEKLQESGLPVDAIDLGFPALGSIQEDSAKIRDRVDRLLVLWGVDRIDIVSHSKGGLDSRDYLEDSNAVALLAQIGPPNAGSPLASLVQRGLTRVPFIGLIGTGIIDLLFPAAYQLTTQYMSVYDSFHGHNPSTAYVSSPATTASAGSWARSRTTS